MARIRTIKPDFWGDPKTAKTSRDARLLFLGLLNESDDEGRQLGSPKRIAGALFPHDDDVTAKMVTRWLDELETVGFIRRYDADGVSYLCIPGFTTHQKVAHPTASRLPPEPLPNFSGGSPEVFAPDLGRGNGTGNREMELAPPERPRDELWESLLDACGINGALTARERGGYNKALKELRDAGATPDEVLQRAKVYRIRWPGVSLTPHALVSHWGQCLPDPAHLPGPKVTHTDAVVAELAAEIAERQA